MPSYRSLFTPTRPVASGGIGVSITGTGRRNTARLLELATVAPGRLVLMSRRSAERVAASANQFAPEHDDDVSNKINEVPIKGNVVVEPTDSPYRWRVVSRGAASATQEYGTPAHLIEPSQADLLHFFWKGAGEWFVGDVVEHPGNAPQPFMAPARSREVPRFTAELRRVFTEFSREWRVLR